MTTPNHAAELEKARQDLALAVSAFEAVQRIVRSMEEIVRAEVMRLQEARNRVALLELHLATAATSEAPAIKA